MKPTVTYAGLESRALRGLRQLLMLGQGHVPGLSVNTNYRILYNSLCSPS